MTAMFKDTIELEGFLSVRRIYSDGRVETDVDEENLLMDRSKAHLLSLIYDRTGTAQTDPIESFKVGSGGVFTATNPAAIKPSTPDMTDLYAPLSGVGGSLYNGRNITHNRNSQDPSFLSTSYPTDVTFTFTLTPNDLVGVSISEVGLFTKKGYMFNHKTFPAIPKTSEFSLQFVWTIKYN